MLSARQQSRQESRGRGEPVRNKRIRAPYVLKLTGYRRVQTVADRAPRDGNKSAAADRTCDQSLGTALWYSILSAARSARSRPNSRSTSHSARSIPLVTPPLVT